MAGIWFPDEQVEINEGRYATVTPLSAEKTILFAEPILRILISVAQAPSPALAIPLCLKEFVQFIPAIIKEDDITLADISGQAVPKIWEIFLKQNVTERFLDHFFALGAQWKMISEKLAPMLPELPKKNENSETSSAGSQPKESAEPTPS